MNQKRNERVDSLLEEALSIEPAARASFLAESCAGDGEILSEVSSLLRCHEQAGSFLETPAHLSRGLDLTTPSSRPLLVPGELLAGRFEIVKPQGRGGMGEVYEAIDRELDVTVALKTIRPEIASDTKAVERFRREVSVARRVSHPNVCRVHDVFHAPSEIAGEILFLSMEFLCGESLARRLERDGRLEWRDAVSILAQIAAGLEAASLAGVVHRDLKPENVMLVREGGRVRAVVSDFGLAFPVDRGEDPPHGVRSLTPVGRRSSRAAWGTPAYMSPEQLRGDAVDHRSDVFSFGVIAYETLSGEHPYWLGSDTTPIGMRFETTPRVLQYFDRRIPKELDRLVHQCLELEPSERPADATELRERLAAIPTELPTRRRVLLAGASLAGGMFLVVKAGPLVLDFVDRWVAGPRILPREDYVDSPQALEALQTGLALVREGANLEAIAYFEKAMAEDADSALVYVELVETLLDVGEDSKASEILAGLETKARNATEERLVGSVRARSREDYHSASEELGVLVEQFPDDLYLGLRHARLLEESGKIMEALPLYEAMSRDSFAATLGLGRALSYTGQPARNIERLWARMDSAGRHVGDEALGMMHSIIGVTLRGSGEYESAINPLKLSLEHRTKAGDRRGQAASLSNLAGVYGDVGRTEEARAMLEHALRLSREMGDRGYESYTLGKMGRLHLISGEPLKAVDYLRESLAIEWARQDHSQLAPRLNEIANTYSYLGLYEDAEITLTEAERHIGPSGQRDQLAYNLRVKSKIAIARGDFETSDRSLSRASVLFQELMMPNNLASVKSVLADTYRMRGAYSTAEKLLEEAVSALNEVQDQFRPAAIEVSQAALQVAQGAFQAAEITLSRAESRLNGLAYWDASARLLLVRGELPLAESDAEKACEFFGHAIEASVRGAFKALEGWGHVGLGRALAEVGQLDAALSALESAKGIALRLGLPPLQAIVALVFSRIYFSLNQWERSVAAARESIELARSLNLKPTLFRANAALGTAHSAMGQAEDAATAFDNAESTHKWLLANVLPAQREAYERHAEVREVLAEISAAL